MRKKTSCCPFTVTEKNLGNLGYNTCRRGAVNKQDTKGQS